MRKSLFGQIFLGFLTVIMLSLSVVGTVTYLQSSKELDDQAERYISQLIDYTTSQTEQYFEQYELSTDSVLSEEDVKNFLEMDPDNSYAFYEFTRDITKNIFQKLFIAYPHIHMVTVIGDHGKSIIDDNRNMVFYPNFDGGEMLDYLNSRVPPDGKIAIFKTEKAEHGQETITIARRIRGFRTYEPKGVLAMEIRSQQFSDLWSTADLGSAASFFIVDKTGNLVFQPQDIDHDVTQPVINRLLDGEDTSFVEPTSGRLFVSRESEYLGWRMVVSLPVEELRGPVSSIRSITIGVGLLTLGIALLMAYKFGQSIIRPIKTLMHGMRETERGIWHKIEDHQRDDEIGGLIHRYNLMVSRLSELVDKIYAADLSQQRSLLELQQTRYERQNAEFQALQLQINPHFLYNTLETINCYAIVQDSEEISEIVEAMAFMLRYSVQTHLEEITLVNELNHVRNYMIIMKHRLDTDFEIDVAVPSEYLLRKMVRLTLQPLVENIFQHAFRDGFEPHHYVRIDAVERGDDFLVTVEDNGVGISPERLELIRRQLRVSEELVQLEKSEESGDGHGTARKSILRKGGIGVNNVHRRIQMVYGADYGLSVDSTEGQGTVITMRMPRV